MGKLLIFPSTRRTSTRRGPGVLVSIRRGRGWFVFEFELFDRCRRRGVSESARVDGVFTDAAMA